MRFELRYKRNAGVVYGEGGYYSARAAMLLIRKDLSEGEVVYYRNFILLITEIRELTAQGYLLPKPFLIKNMKVETDTT